ncbi:MAG: hypothetical protein GF330_05885, partial [Candidatus Eisenbacteria bacterium]|nr:hypothetical protein [Candidatus Eisenbacteria bacterium]
MRTKRARIGLSIVLLTGGRLCGGLLCGGLLCGGLLAMPLASGEMAAASAIPQTTDDAAPIAGLDSLSSATLQRALDYLEIHPAELGFEKLYAEDDTFRLGIVEALLGDPLRIPLWQQETREVLRQRASDPAALAAQLGALIEAPVPEEALDTRRLGREGWTQIPASSTHWRGDRSGEAFLAGCRQAERLLQRAFAALTPAERDTLLIHAPAMWGNPQEDPVDRAQRGALHFELGAPADTSIEIGEDQVLDYAARIDRDALTAAAAAFLAALADYVPQAPNTSPGAERQLPGVHGALSGIFETPWGRLVIGSHEDNVYDSHALSEIAFLIDPGGDDVYRGRAASAIGDLGRSLSAVIDLAGDDFYDAGDRAYALGGAVLGLAALIDVAGDDVYRGGDGCQGAACFGAGFLYDGRGTDQFRGRNLCQGAGAFGIGALVSDAAPHGPPGPELQPDRAYEAGLVAVAGTGALPIRYDENDTYQCARFSQGFASTFGIGLLHDRQGNDTYRSGGHYLHAPLLPHDFQSLSQGYSIGFRPRAAGGIGILLDDAGNDFYAAEVYAQGVSYWYSIGLLCDGGGNDRYLATQYAQGAGVHLAVGSLWDGGGDDHYACKFGVTQGTSHDLSAGWLIDASGNDYYLVSDGQGISITNSASLFLDQQGDDFYATPRGGQGKVTWARGFCGAGIFLDLEGHDVYARESAGIDGGVWSQDLHAIGIDLDRDLTLPGEDVPEITLTAEDSARTIEELFETASIWEVGSAREKVRRARQALHAKGIPALDYVVAEKLGTTSGLEYRAIESLAREYPDSFLVRLLPRLDDPDERVQRNVIGLLGGLERAEACAPLVERLRDRTHEEQWTRIIHALGRIGETEVEGLDVRAALRPMLRDAQERRRIYTAAALRALRDTVAIPALVDLLEDRQLTVRAAAHAALRRFQAAAIPDLVAGLEAASSHRATIVRTLGRAAEALRDSTDAVSLTARGAARRALLAELQRRPG